MQIQISWLLQKPTDLDLHCLQRQNISGFSRTRVETLMGMANHVDPEKIVPEGAVGFALFAYAILSETLVYKILGYLSYHISARN